jgi:hypothetical protein
MPAIKLSVPHKLGAAEAKKRITKLIGEVRQQFGDLATDVRESWDGNIGTFSFRAMGLTVQGTLEVQPAEVKVEINLPMAALPFKGRVEQEISARAKALLA